ncbi:MAG: TIR domain-containing protein [Proteobacteria bacterium]|nr:TIR domain-containing protein [Pseudomonadota bacterium]
MSVGHLVDFAAGFTYACRSSRSRYPLFMNPTVRVFISYSHDTSEHRAFILAFANRLRGEGLDCQIDQYVPGFPPEGWQRWMENQIEQADFVLIVCTPVYLQRYRGNDPDGGRGVNFEGVVISQTLYDHYYRNTKFIPIIPGHGSLDDVPLPLKGYTTYTLPQDYTALYRLLTGQHATPAPGIGGMIYLPPETGSGLALNVSIAQQAVQVASYTNLPDAAVQTLVAQLQKQLSEEKRNNHNLSDLLERYRNDVAEWERKYRDALEQNAADLRKNPENPQLLAEQQALQAGELEQAAQIRERYYQNLKREKTAELAQEAYTAAERWENAFNMPKALALYQEAVIFRRDYPEAWRNIGSIAGKLGNSTLALEAAQNLQKQLDPEKDRRWFAIALRDEADVLSALGNNRKALEKYRQSQLLLEQLVKAEPDNLNLQCDLSVSHNRVGDMHVKNGDNATALKAYQDDLTIAKRLAEFYPNHTSWQRDLSVSYERVGDMHMKSGDNAAALKAYQDGLAIAKRLAELDPSHTEWQRDLFVSHTKVGDMHVKSGDNAAALKAYQDGLAIAKKLAELDPNHMEWQRDLSVSHNRVGDMHMKSGDNTAALKAYQDGLAIAKRLAELDQNHTEWQRDMFVSHTKVGDMHVKSGDNAAALKAYQDSLAIAKRLVELDPNHTQWQSDLSLSYDRVGDMYVKSGDNAAALKAYQYGLAIAKRLAELDPKHTEWQRDLSVSYNKIGGVHEKTGDNAAALKAYQDDLTIAKKLAELDPAVVQWQTDLVVSYVKLSQIQKERRKELWANALDILYRLQRENRLDHEKQQWIGTLEGMLQPVSSGRDEPSAEAAKP